MLAHSLSLDMLGINRTGVHVTMLLEMQYNSNSQKKASIAPRPPETQSQMRINIKRSQGARELGSQGGNHSLKGVFR